MNCAGQTREAEKIVMHENYNTGGAFANDIALIKLDEPFWINNVSKSIVPNSEPPIFFSRWCTICVFRHQAGHHKTTKRV